MAKENKLGKLEKRKFELIRNIKLCNDYKKDVIINWSKLKESFNQGFISHEEYYKRLSKSKFDEWIKYYDDSIKYYKNKLNICEEGFVREKQKIEERYINREYLIIFLALISIIGIFLLIGRPEFGPTGYVISRGETNESYYNPNGVIGGNVTIEIRLGDHIPNASSVNVSFESQSNFTVLEDFTYATDYICDANSSERQFNDIDDTWTWEADTGYGYSFNESAECTDGGNFTANLNDLFPTGLIAPATQGYYYIKLNATYDSTNEQVVYSETLVQVGQVPSDPIPIVNSTTSDQQNYTNETLACNFLCSDPDTSDTLTYDIYWYKEGIYNQSMLTISCSDPEYVSYLFDSANTTKGELWSCLVNITNEGLNSSTVFSNNVTINNYSPVINGTLSNATQSEDFVDLADLIPVGDFNANFTDIDEGETTPSSYTIISQSNSSTSCYLDGSNNLDCSSVANASGTDLYTFELNNSDSFVRYDWQIIVNVVNDAPTIPELNLPNNNTQIEDNIFTVELNWSNSSDVENDAITYYLEIWNESTTTNILYVNSSISETVNTTSDLVTFPSESADYFWRVIANDGTDNSSDWSELRNISFSYLITNTAPSEPTGVLLNSTLAAQTNLTNENLAANFLCSDPDTSDTLTYDLYWYKEGIYNQSMLTISCTDPEYVSYIFDETNTSKGENWSFSVNVTDIGGLSSPTVFSNNLTIENSNPEINYVSLNNSISPFDGGIRQFEFSFVANDNDTTSDLDDTKAITNVSLGTENYLNSSCYAEGDVTGGRNYSCTIEMQYYYASGSWNYGTEIKDDSGIAVQNSTGDNNEVQTWYYSELAALNLSVSVLTWAQLIPSQTNQTATSNPIVIENTGNKAVLNIFAKAIDLIGASGKYIPAANFTIGNITSASQAECDYTNQTSAVTPGITPLVFVNNTNIYPVINTLLRGQGSNNNLYYCLFDVPADLQSESYATQTGTEWDISVE